MTEPVVQIAPFNLNESVIAEAERLIDALVHIALTTTDDSSRRTAERALDPSRRR